jgi:predicted dinucleotide-utilizing enzyme
MSPFQVPVDDPRNALKMPKVLELTYEGNSIEVFQSFPRVLKIYMTLSITNCETETFLNHQ